MRPIITRSYASLQRLEQLGVDVFHCAHHWVTDESIVQELANLQAPPDILTCTHHLNCRCNHAEIVAGMVHSMVIGVKFPPLYLCVHERRIRGAVSSLELVDGHHRLRAYQFLRRTESIQWAVKGDALLLKRSVEQARRF